MALKKCKECGKNVSSSAEKCPHCGKNQQNWFMRHKVFSFILGIVISIVVIAAIDTSTTDSNKTKEFSQKNEAGIPQEVSDGAKEEIPQKEETWTIVKSWKGSGIKKTEVFNITGKQWRINWSSKPTADYGGIMQIYVQRPGSDVPVEVAANSMEESSDTSYVYKSGEFILNINAANTNWIVEIEELK